jgi:hypothetical protein
MRFAWTLGFASALAITACAPSKKEAMPAPPPKSAETKPAEPKPPETKTEAPKTAEAKPVPQKPSLLVMPLRAEAELKSAARALDEMILSAIHDTGRYQVLGPSDLNALLGVEKMKDALGCDDVRCAAELGGALGAPFVVEGQLGRLDKEAVLSLRLMDVDKAVVLERATARGQPSGEALAKMMASAVGGLLHTDVKIAAETVAPTAPAGGYGDYMSAVTALGRRMSNFEYSAMLADLDRYENQKIDVPPNVDLKELFAFYRTTACYMLKRPCLETAAKAYLSGWPSGTYGSSVQNYLDQVEDAKLKREAKADELKKRLEEIEGRRGKGTFTDDLADEQIAYAYFGSGENEKAAAKFAELMKRKENDEDKVLSLLQTYVYALSAVGRFDEARAALEAAQQRYPKAFRLKNLHQTLRTLPR